MALESLRNDPEAGWELSKKSDPPLSGVLPDFLMVSQDCRIGGLCDDCFFRYDLRARPVSSTETARRCRGLLQRIVCTVESSLLYVC